MCNGSRPQSVPANHREREGSRETATGIPGGGFAYARRGQSRPGQLSGRVLLRYSGTEPKARVMVEAEQAADVAQWSERLATAVRSAIGA